MTFLPKAFVVAYQQRLIELFGGSPGIRDEGLLESALAQPEASFDVWEMAAAYCFHLAQNHPFVDGNKRIAAVAMGAFLDVNGAPLVAPEEEVYNVVLAVASGRLSKVELAAWLRERRT